MFKAKIKEAIKVVAVSTAAIGILSAGYIGLNRTAFAQSTNGGASILLPPVQTERMLGQNTDAAFAPIYMGSVSEGFEHPTLNIYTAEFNTPGVNALCPDTAAWMGAMYIWDVFGESINGMSVEMSYHAWPSHTRTYWFGRVVDSREALTGEDLMRAPSIFDFSIDSVTGERINMLNVTSVTRSLEVNTALNQQIARSGYGRYVDGTGDTIFDTLYNMRVSQQMPERLNEQKQVAVDIVQRHCPNTVVANVEFLTFGIGGLDVDDSGDLVILSHTLAFHVTNTNGRVIEVIFDEITGEVREIVTSLNDVIPGFGLGNHAYGVLDEPMPLEYFDQIAQ